MKRIIATILAATALVGASQAFAYERTTVTTTRTVEAHSRYNQHDDWRQRQWQREQEHRRWAAHHEYHRGY